MTFPFSLICSTGTIILSKPKGSCKNCIKITLAKAIQILSFLIILLNVLIQKVFNMNGRMDFLLKSKFQLVVIKV